MTSIWRWHIPCAIACCIVVNTIQTLDKGGQNCWLSVSRISDGPQLGNNLINLGSMTRCQAVTEGGLELDDLIEQEEEPGLGNGGLGRLAACFLDSLTTLDIPAVGYSIRYEFGIFDQEIRWLASRNYRQYVLATLGQASRGCG